MQPHKMQAEDIIQYDYYISGGMSGYEDYNFPAFNEAAKDLREQGYSVFNPAESFNSDLSLDLDYEDYLRVDTIAVAQCRKILLLPGWRESRGACYEYLVAKTLGLEIEKLKSDDREAWEGDDMCRIALTGLARTGKDTVGEYLSKFGLNKVAMGSTIKSQLDPIIQAHLGHSASVEDDELKENIRGTLVEWGFSNYDNIIDEFFEGLPKLAVNTRLFREREARRWKENGGVIWEVKRPGSKAAEPKEEEELERMRDLGLIDNTINNDGSKRDLYHKVAKAVYDLGVELWKPIKGYDGYEISNKSRVRSWKKGNGRWGRASEPYYLTQHKNCQTGYFQFQLCKDGNPKRHTTHAVVAKTFVPNPNNLATVNHKDGVKENNMPYNLEWNSYADNNKHARDKGLCDVSGTKNYNAKLTEKEVLRIRSLANKTDYTHQKIADDIGISRATVTNVVNRKTWRHI